MNYLLKASFFTFLFSGSALATPKVSVETKYYPIYGATADMLRKEMNTKSSIRQSGKTYDAYTYWYVSWRFNWNTKNGQCHITTVSSTVDVKFTLPKWVNCNDSDSTLKNKWDRYYSALIDHENGHKDFAVNAANEVEEKLLKLTSSSSCPLLEERANALGTKIINKHIALEMKYDKSTNHGMNNGAKFP